MLWIPGSDDSSLRDLSSQLQGEGRFRPYTPLWKTTGTQPSLGNGSLKGQWAPVGGMIFVVVAFVAGSTTTFGTGNFSVTLPRYSNCPLDIFGPLYLFDSGVQGYHGFCSVTSISDRLNFQTPGSVTPTTPFTWGTNDGFKANIMYPVP